ncbi:hypothetical protein MGN70_002113 [Eutypa lata]|uniref:Putative spherulin 1a protein n=1 Tax=Eutypa lata (strain UCR-EL1) TaxID=1287681 RepID=M7T1I1_EUTLA|nr:putative spherulin 1a precursor protein [Eutypa lata UCREL1]KAI1255954.1 hypothetical protein MGN70_002113 [Eutypa lata]
MLPNVFASAFTACLLAAATASPIAERATTPPTAAEIQAIQEALVLAPTQELRQALLLPNPPDATNYTFQFTNNTVLPPTGGTIGLATINNFPALIGTRVGMAIGFVNACGLNTPHSHPRANEFLTVVQGELVAGLVLESDPGGAGNLNGTNPTGPIPMVNATLSNFQGFLFPQGETHFQFNPTCEPAVFAAAFDSADPGRTQLATTFFSEFPDDVLLSATGNNLEQLDAAQIDQLRGKIPQAFAELIDSCAQKCGIPTS